MATMTPRPTVTSQAATTMTMIAKIWPSPLPCMRLKAMSARFAALSISSRQSRMTSGLRRVSTPPAPMQNTIADTARYQPMFTGVLRSAGLRACSRCAPGVVPVGRPRPSRIEPVPGGHAEQVGDGDLPARRALEPAAAAGEDDGADGGDEQQEGRDLERQQELRQQQLADLAGLAEAGAEVGALAVDARQPGAEQRDG